ncbi:MAG: hypothetical protein ACK47B_24910 [Armatimonadota bacterium]
MRNRLPTIGILALVSAALLLGTAGGQQPEPPVTAPEPRQPLAQAWSRPLADVVGVTVTPDGARVLAVVKGGRILAHDRAGEVVWERQLKGVDSLAAGPEGSMVVAYTERDPRRRQVHFLTGYGLHFHTLEPTEPVRSAIVSPDGRFAAIIAGSSVLFCGRGPDGRVKVKVLDPKGDPAQLRFGQDDSLYVVTRSPMAVRRIKSTGRELWSMEEPGVRRYSIDASRDGRTVAVVSERTNGQLFLELLTSARSRRWRLNLPPGHDPWVRLSADEAAAAVSYEHPEDERDVTGVARRLAYYSGPGEGWVKGGPFQSPIGICVGPGGEWVVALDPDPSGGGALRLFGRDGQRRWPYALQGDVLIAAAALDGGTVALYRSDGVLEAVEVTAESGNSPEPAGQEGDEAR